MGLHIRDDRQMKALTGLSQDQFDYLLPVFSDISRATQQQTYEEGMHSGTRRRRPGGGSKGKLPTMVEKLQFVLYYYKTYPTFDVLGTQFAMARSKAHENLHKLSPILYDTWVHLDLLPYREFTTPEELKAALQGGWIASSLIPPNAPIIVPQMMPNNVSMTVEKKQPTLKNTVMALPDKFIVFLGRTLSGHNHDYSMLKTEFPPELDWFADLHVRVDLGYLGIQTDSRGDRIDIPTKKPRKSKQNPTPQLSDEQKAANTALSQIRIFIEHAIGGMKRYNILVHVFRNRKAEFEDDAIGICAGLWNFALSY